MLSPKFISYLFALTLLPQFAFAGCDTTPDCETLGYSMNATDCDTSKPILKCFNDPSKAICNKCAIGSILFSDKTCASKEIRGKTPIGIIFNTDKRLAMGVNFGTDLYWMDPSMDIPIINASNRSEAFQMLQGKKNTLILCEKSKNYNARDIAADYANSYVTEGTKAGDWYLPSSGEAFLMARVANQIRMTLRRVFNNNGFKYKKYWTSTGYSATQAYTLDSRYSSAIGMITISRQNEYFDVIPILHY